MPFPRTSIETLSVARRIIGCHWFPGSMVCIGTSSPGKAAEVMEISQALLARRAPRVTLQETRRKASPQIFGRQASVSRNAG